MAILEKLVSIEMDLLPEDLCIAALEIPKSKILKIPKEELPKNWKHYHSPDALKALVKARLSWGFLQTTNPKCSKFYGVKLSY